MSLGILSQDGEVILHRKRKASPDALLQAIAPSRDDIVIAVACIFTWYWLADLGAQAGLPLVLGHALSLTASPGGQTKNDTMDSQQIAVRLRGGLLPQADVSPAALRAPRDLLRRRTQWMRKRAEWLAHLQHTQRQYHRPERGQKSAATATRDGVAERFPAPAGQKSLAGDRALIGPDDQLLRAGELSILTTAKQQKAQTLSLRRTVPGIGELLRLVLLSAIPASPRCPRGQECLAYGRLVTGTKASAGKRDGTSGTKRGNAPRTGACSAAAVLFLRAHPAGPKARTTREKKPGSGTAWPLWGQQLGRTVYDRLPRPTAFAMGKVLNGSGSGADEPNASLDHHGLSRRVVRCQACVAASVNA